MHSTKQTMQNKGTQFGYKNFVWKSSDGYPYHIILYCGARRIVGKPEKDLTSLVLIDNWYVSTKVMSFLNALKIPAICTARARVETVQLLPTKQTAKEKNGVFSNAFDEEVGLHCV